MCNPQPVNAGILLDYLILITILNYYLGWCFVSNYNPAYIRNTSATSQVFIAARFYFHAALSCARSALHASSPDRNGGGPTADADPSTEAAAGGSGGGGAANGVPISDSFLWRPVSINVEIGPRYARLATVNTS